MNNSDIERIDNSAPFIESVFVNRGRDSPVLRYPYRRAYAGSLDRAHCRSSRLSSRRRSHRLRGDPPDGLSRKVHVDRRSDLLRLQRLCHALVAGRRGGPHDLLRSSQLPSGCSPAHWHSSVTPRQARVALALDPHKEIHDAPNRCSLRRNQCRHVRRRLRVGCE
jgi:hypothetical protein